ncbi:MAG: hypothetical protein AAB414_02890 [Patescibacteria group bacterium]
MDTNTKNPTDPNLPTPSTDVGATLPPSPTDPDANAVPPDSPLNPPLQPSQSAMQPQPTPSPIQSEPIQPDSSWQPASPSPATWPPTLPPVSEPPPPSEPVPPTTSPLDNPWGAPIQPPPIDSTLPNPQPSPDLPPDSTNSLQSASTESVPTDLSHLITNTSPQDPIQEVAPTSETLVVPPANGAPEVPTLPTEDNNRGIPKWVIGLGIGLLIVVAGTSAYFILGIGQPPKATNTPQNETPTNQQIKAPPPVSQPSPSTATDSGTFGELEEGGSQQATSAADLIRQRQQQGQ